MNAQNDTRNTPIPVWRSLAHIPHPSLEQAARFLLEEAGVVIRRLCPLGWLAILRWIL